MIDELYNIMQASIDEKRRFLHSLYSKDFFIPTEEEQELIDQLEEEIAEEEDTINQMGYCMEE